MPGDGTIPPAGADTPKTRVLQARGISRDRGMVILESLGVLEPFGVMESFGVMELFRFMELSGGHGIF